jgi:hypothetical protein
MHYQRVPIPRRLSCSKKTTGRGMIGSLALDARADRTRRQKSMTSALPF